MTGTDVMWNKCWNELFDIRLDWLVLTNFEETRLYDTCTRSSQCGDLAWSIKFTEYESKFNKLWMISVESLISCERLLRRKSEFVPIFRRPHRLTPKKGMNLHYLEEWRYHVLKKS